MKRKQITRADLKEWATGIADDESDYYIMSLVEELEELVKADRQWLIGEDDVYADEADKIITGQFPLLDVPRLSRNTLREELRRKAKLI